MPRTADQIFLKLAVQQGALTPEDAADIHAELERLEADGSPSKARLLCLELGFMDEAHARQLKQEVRGHLEKKEREVEVDSRSERRIAGFELLERLGSGAMGVVFKARHLKLNKIVALKLLNPDFAQEERSVARFLQEAQVAAALNHANIVQAYDVGQAGDVHYIAMEYVDGKTVKELIERRGQLDEQAAIEIVLQVLDALKHAHSRSLIHRDIKPANIMITREGQAKVLDLGLARRTDVESGLTGEGRAIGTPYFMAPEQALDKGADYRADIYALGATFYNMVTGAKPYVAGTPVAVMNMHLKAPIPDAHQTNAKVSKGLAKIISKMLAKRPSDRYQDHDALIKDLEAVLGGLMPDLDGGRPPEGMDCISRPQGAVAPRSRPQRAAAAGGAGKPGMLLIGGAAAACLLLGVGFMAHARNDTRGNGGQVADGGTVDEPDTSEPFDREAAATAALAEVNQTPVRPKEPQSTLDHASELENIAKQFPETEAGKRASQEAQRLLRELDDDEQARLDSRRTQLDALVAQGKLQEALAGFEELVATIQDMRLRSEADASANQDRLKIQAKLDEIQREVDGLARSGREREAAVALRRALSLLSSDKRARLMTKIDELEGLAAAKEAEARAKLARAEAEHAEEDEERLELLAGQLSELVVAGKAQEALSAAEEAAAATVTPALKAKALLHRDAVAAIVALEGLAAQSFEKLVGQKVELERRRGAPIEGEVTRVQGDKLAIAVLSRAELLVGAADLSDDELLRVVRKGFSATHPPYLHGVAALRLYQGGADAEAAVARARDAGIDLTAVQDDLRAARARAAGPAVVGDVSPDAPTSDPGGVDVAGDLEADKRQEEEARLRYDRDRRLHDNRERLFPESESGGIDGGQLALIYVYFTNSRDFGEDWKRISGKSQLLPPGANDRIGLTLEGDNGRANFTAPIEGDFKLEVEFMSQLFGKEGRLAIVAETDNQRVDSNLGELVYQRRRARPQRTGENQHRNIRQQRRHTLELSRLGDQITTKFDGTVTGAVTVEGFGKTRLAIEWGNASLNLSQIRMRMSPEAEWVEKKLAPQ